MKKLPLVLAALSGLALTTPSAHAMFWQSAKVATPRTYEVGGVGQLTFDPSKFMAYADLIAGITPRLAMEARFGDGGYDFYMGGFGKYALAFYEGIQFSLFGGIYNQGNAYFEVAPMATIDLGRVDFTVGPDFSFSLGDRSSFSSINLGLSIPYERQFSFFGELDIKLSNFPSSVMAGMRARF